ncbi:MAG: LiaF-related protein [Dehalococcoidales bacterium]|nr:LiaF-related protein [Dehalococcoidales bacterium]
MNFTAIFSAVKIGEQPWKPEDKNNSLAFFGAASLDFRKAEMKEETTKLNATSIFGATKVTVPPDIQVNLSGFSFFGGKRSKLSEKREASAKYTKQLNISATCIFGAFEVIE